MNGIGLDCGNATLKLVLLCPEGKFLCEKTAFHYGAVVQSARFLTGLDQNTPPRFAVNEHCAGGTGSFFEDQMSRVGCKLENYSCLLYTSPSPRDTR
mgnify:CR=1 FL=1